MVQLLEELPLELLAHIAGTIVAAAAAGRWTQASRASRLLLLPRLDQLLEARRSARPQAVMLDKLSLHRGSAAAIMGNSDAAIRVLPRKLDMFTCACCAGDRVRSIGLSIGCTNVRGHLISNARCTGPHTATKFMDWALLRSPGAYLRMEQPHERRNVGQQVCSRHSMSTRAV